MEQTNKLNKLGWQLMNVNVCKTWNLYRRIMAILRCVIIGDGAMAADRAIGEKDVPAVVYP